VDTRFFPGPTVPAKPDAPRRVAVGAGEGTVGAAGTPSATIGATQRPVARRAGGRNSMSPEDLVEIEAIKTLKYATCAASTEGLGPGGSAASPRTRGRVRRRPAVVGRDAILGFLRDSLSDEGFVTSHCVTQPEIEITGPDRARGSCSSATW